MNIEKIKNTVFSSTQKTQALENAKKAQISILQKKISIIEQSFNQLIKEVNTDVNSLKKQYYDIAFELAIEKKECPLSHSGQPIEPNDEDIHIDEDGISFCWTIEHSYSRDSYYSFTASWEEILLKHN